MLDATKNSTPNPNPNFIMILVVIWAFLASGCISNAYFIFCGTPQNCPCAGKPRIVSFPENSETNLGQPSSVAK